MARSTLIFLAFALSLSACIGPQGETGPTGNTGAQGLTGPQGPQGDVGPAGPKGQTGPDGEVGPDGASGADGADVLSRWVTSPGVVLSLTSSALAPDGTLSVDFTLTDPNGVPLDTAGRYSEGVVTPGFMIAWLAEDGDDAGTYTSYLTRSQAGGEPQASTDTGGTLTVVDAQTGAYHYQFGAELLVDPANVDKTHTIGVQARRTMLDGTRYADNALVSFRPDGAPVSTTRDIVTTDACNACHGTLAAHGSSRREVGLCVLCHQPQTTDVDTGNTADFTTMIHKIHRGETLPSVVAGGTYAVGSTSHDYSTVVFPGDLKRCATCHTGAQADYWKTKPGLRACGSCHDTISFEVSTPSGMTAHTGQPQADDTMCASCHFPFKIEGYHTSAIANHSALEATLDSVSHTAPGQAPVVAFTLSLDGAPLNVGTNPPASLSFNIAGPNTDFAGQTSYKVANPANDLVPVTDGSDGQYTWTLPMTVPVDAVGSYSLAVEARVVADGVTLNAFNHILPFAVTDTAPVARRDIVDTAKCNACHLELRGHGGSRTNIDYCSFCHNANNANDERGARWEGSDWVANSVDFKTMIHGIHRGEAHVSEYTLGAYPLASATNPGGALLLANDVRFPGRLADCETCHNPGTYGLPLGANVLPTYSALMSCTEDPTADTDEYCSSYLVTGTSTPPTAAVCTSCHDAPSTAAHAEIMTSASGVESCDTCHGAGKSADIASFHTPLP